MSSYKTAMCPFRPVILSQIPSSKSNQTVDLIKFVAFFTKFYCIFFMRLSFPLYSQIDEYNGTYLSSRQPTKMMHLSQESEISLERLAKVF
jgi:hypothetical protein